MSSYFYHLAFELYPKSESSITNNAVSSGLYLPPPNTNIFTTPLPVHRVASWGTERTKRQVHRRTVTESVGSERLKLRTNSFDAPLAVPRPGLTTTSDKNSQSRRVLPLHALSERQRSPETKDWRFEAVTVQSIDMINEHPATGPGQPRRQSLSQSTHAGTSAGGVATRGKFIPSEPKNTDVGYGVVHLYRDAQETPGLYDETSSGDDGEADGTPFNLDDCTTLCMLAVPSYMSPSDLLGFVGEQTREDVSHFRLIRTGRANKYMVLMKFREANRARAWRKEWNGKLFNSMEPEYCHVVFVRSITFQTPDSMQQSSFPDMTNDPFVQKVQNTVKSPSAGPLESPSSLTSPLTTKPFAPPTPNLIELPTCPVCLERMDETTGLLTVLCQHVFHCACLEKWRGTGCPVCRYTQNSAIPGRQTASDEEVENQCSVCGAEANLWICLICGNVGCGRYDSAHAFAHYEATRHSYAMDISTQHVWDYAGDGYVHRLIQNKTDGKLVHLPAARYTKNPSGGMIGLGADMVPREKMEAMGNEYAYLLTSQLDSQRRYFEEQLERAVDKASRASAAADAAAAHLDTLSARFQALERSHASLQSTLRDLERETTRTTRRADRADERARTLARDAAEEKTLNDSLMARVRHLEARLVEAAAVHDRLAVEKRELEEQNRDLGFFISGGEKLRAMQEQGEEVVDGTVEVPVPVAEGGDEAEGEKGGGKKKRKGKGRRK